eukprot:gene4629-5236_t
MAFNGNEVKKVRFYRDGDANFSGVSVAISKAKYRSFDSLLSDLSRKVPLPFGVRSVHTPGGIHHVYDIDQIENGGEYVCSTFNKRPIKKMDYAGRSSRPSWRLSKTTMDGTAKQGTSNETDGKLFQMPNIKPKTITIVARDDPSNKAKLILNRRTAMSYESVLQTISDILQLNTGAVRDLFTMEGKKIGCLSDLIRGPDLVVAAGRNSGSISARSLPSRLLKKRNHQKANSLPNSSKKSLSCVAQRQKLVKKSPYTQSQTPRAKGKKVKGNPYVVTVKTSDTDDAGTEGNVTVVIYGSKGRTGDIKLGPTSTKKFLPGTQEEFEIDVGSIGKIYKLRVIHDDQDDSESGWHLQQIILTSVARKNEELIFHCDKWFSNIEEEGGSESVRELAATKNGKALAEDTTYEISVITGEVASGATDANVFVNIFGEKGDTGKRWLQKLKNDDGEMFQPGSINVFEIEAVSLEKLTKITIGHDNTGEAPGWFLDKVLIKDVKENAEYVCTCRKWLDEDEDDGKTERVIKVTQVDPVQTSKQLWTANEWKFEDSNEAIMVSAVNGKTLTVDTSSCELIAADDKGNNNDENNGSNSTFVISQGGETKSRIFAVKTEQGTFNLTLDNGKVSVVQGKPGLLSEFYIDVHQGNLMSLESVVHKGSYIGLSESGGVEVVAKDCEEKQNLFNVCIKGVLRNLGRIKLRPSFNQACTLIENNGYVYGDGDGKDEGGEFVVHKIGKGIRAFQSATTDMFLRVTAESIDCKGDENSDEHCQFNIHKDRKSGSIQLESVKMPGVFLGVGKHGKVKHAVDTGDEITSLTIEVISFGSKDMEKSSGRSQAVSSYGDVFENEVSSEDEAPIKDSVLPAKDQDFESQQASSRQSEERVRSGRSSRNSARSKLGSAASERADSRPASSKEEALKDAKEDVEEEANEIAKEVVGDSEEEAKQDVEEEAIDNADGTKEDIKEVATKEAENDSQEDATKDAEDKAKEDIEGEAQEEANEEVKEDAMEEETKESVGEEAKDNAEEATEDVEEEAKEDTEEAKEDVKEDDSGEAKDNTEGTTKDVQEEAKEDAEKAEEDVKEDASEEAKNNTEGTTNGVEEEAKEDTEKAEEDVKEDALEEAKDSVEEATKDVEEEAREDLEKDNKEEAKDNAEVTTKDVEEEAKDVKEDVNEDALKEAEEDVKEEPTDNTEEAKEDLEKPKEDDNEDASEEAKDSTEEATKDVEEEAKEDTEEAKEDVKEDASEEAKDNIEETAKDVEEEVKDSAEEATKDVTEDASEDAKDSTEEATKDVEEEADEDTEKAKEDDKEDASEEAKDSTEETTKDAEEEAKEDLEKSKEDDKEDASEGAKDSTEEATKDAEEEDKEDLEEPKEDTEEGKATNTGEDNAMSENKILSPTPPKEPRDSSARRRSADVRSRLSNSSRLSSRSPTKLVTEQNEVMADDKAIEKETPKEDQGAEDEGVRDKEEEEGNDVEEEKEKEEDMTEKLKEEAEMGGEKMKENEGSGEVKEEGEKEDVGKEGNEEIEDEKKNNQEKEEGADNKSDEDVTVEDKEDVDNEDCKVVSDKDEEASEEAIKGEDDANGNKTDRNEMEEGDKANNNIEAGTEDKDSAVERKASDETITSNEIKTEN